MNYAFKKFLIKQFNCERATQPINWNDYIKDAACIVYLQNIPLDNELADIREQIDQTSLLKIIFSTDETRNIVYSCLEQKLNDLVDEYNAELFQDSEDHKPFNPNRAMEDAGHKHSDFF